MIKFLLSLVLTVISVSLFAQLPSIGLGAGPQRTFEGKIIGVLLDSLTKEPIEFASVGLYEQGKESSVDGVLTDGGGNFKLKKSQEWNLSPEYHFHRLWGKEY